MREIDEDIFGIYFIEKTGCHLSQPVTICPNYRKVVPILALIMFCTRDSKPVREIDEQSI